MHISSIVFILSLLFQCFYLSQAYISCSTQEDFCQDDSTCCPFYTTTGILAYGCLPSNPHIKGPGSCCIEETLTESATGCAGNFKCSLQNQTKVCTFANKNANETIVMPRYQLFPVDSKSIRNLYGFPIEYQEIYNERGAVAAYYSTKGPILTYTLPEYKHGDIQAVVIVVHGSGRNADEYLYSMNNVANLQTRYKPENILVIAPNFLAVEDGIYSVPVVLDDNTTIQSSPMKWNETDPIPHTWRYGNNALDPFDRYSSYHVMDAIIEAILEKYIKGDYEFRNLERIVCAGHSAGGQFIQRWALTSNSYIWNDDKYMHTNRISSIKTFRKLQMRRKLPEIIAVVANPRSYAYLDRRRWRNSTYFAEPTMKQKQKCKTYDSWEWGLSKGGILPCPYKDATISMFNGNTSEIADRYSNRNVIYLSGMNDTEILHGSCEDDRFQGRFRRERSFFFYESLNKLFGRYVHSRVEIENVGHDHSLIFEDPKAINEIFPKATCMLRRTCAE